MYSKCAWEKYENYDEIFSFNEEYKHFLTNGKNERLVVKETVELAKKKGFKDINEFTSLKKGDKVYVLNRNKNVLLFIIGEESLTKGINILGAHIDSPRLDLKQNPLYENSGFALLDTHYYGGIKKYQWVTIPLSLIGVVIKKDGTVVDINIGEDKNDPVVGISDLLIHLSADQLQKKAGSVIEGEKLDITIASIPLKGSEKDSVKANVLKLIKEKYDIEEEDFLSAEIEVVPQMETKDYGLDRSMVAGYGHDDRVCAYTSLRAILDIENPKRTACCYLVDKEEVGSIGATGAQSRFFENSLAKIISLKEGNYNDLMLRDALSNTFMLSSDVSAGVDPLFLEVNELKNSAFLGKGIVFNKYTGSRGKGGCNDAFPEFIAKLRNILDKNNVNYQTAELGKVDQGGGGTIAYILGNLNMTVIDAGVAVLNMHSPMEIVSKVDVYEAYLAYKTFLEEME